MRFNFVMANGDDFTELKFHFIINFSNKLK